MSLFILQKEIQNHRICRNSGTVCTHGNPNYLLIDPVFKLDINVFHQESKRFTKLGASSAFVQVKFLVRKESWLVRSTEVWFYLLSVRTPFDQRQQFGFDKINNLKAVYGFICGRRRVALIDTRWFVLISLY